MQAPGDPNDFCSGAWAYNNLDAIRPVAIGREGRGGLALVPAAGGRRALCGGGVTDRREPRLCLEERLGDGGAGREPQAPPLARALSHDAGVEAAPEYDCVDPVYEE